MKRQSLVFEGKFDGQSHYTQNFQGAMSPPPQMIQTKPNISLGSDKLDLQSTYNKNFIGVPSEVPQPIVKKNNLEVGSGKFDGGTSYH